MNANPKAEMTLICGCNGAGKSTLTFSSLTPINQARYIDPDRIAKEQACSPMQSGRIVLGLTKKYLDEKTSFLKESTLTSKFDFALIESAKQAGFTISLVYISLQNADRAVERVRARHKKGGHTVPENDIRRRYDRSLENLAKAVKLVDRASIFDNSGRAYIPVATFQNGQLQTHDASPAWFMNALKILTTT